MNKTQAAHLLVNLLDSEEGITTEHFNDLLDACRDAFHNDLDYIFMASEYTDGWFYLDHEQALGIHEMIDQGA